MKKWVYIAGPITKGSTTSHVHRACEVWDVLRQLGYHPICPHWSVIQDMIRPVPHEVWMEYDFEILLMCDAILRIPGESVGADREIVFAAENRIPVFYTVAELLEGCPPCPS